MLRLGRILVMGLAALFIGHPVYATGETQRIPHLTNDKVSVWETIIYPHAQQKLALHRHEHDRVVFALTDGTLKITNDQHKTHYLKLVKNHVYYLLKDAPGLLHTDENVTSQPIKVLVIELK